MSYIVSAATDAPVKSAVDNGPLVFNVDRDLAFLETEWVTERNELMGFLRGHHAGNYRRCKYRSFLRSNLVAIERRDNFYRQLDNGTSMRFAIGCRLFPPILYISTLLNAWCSAASVRLSSL